MPAEAKPDAVESAGPGRPRLAFRLTLWQLALLVAFSAYAIAEIQNYRLTDPKLVALAATGFAGYAVLAWLAWAYASRFEGRVARVVLVGLYLAFMAGLFLLATVIYLVIERLYLDGRF